MQHYYRKMVETAGSLIEQLLPKSIHAVTSQGFERALLRVGGGLHLHLKQSFEGAIDPGKSQV